MFRIKASYTGQLELKTTLERAREFFGELTNFADLMPGIEGIRKESSGIVRWLVRAEVPVIGAVHASFAVEKTDQQVDLLRKNVVIGILLGDRDRIIEFIIDLHDFLSLTFAQG